MLKYKIDNSMYLLYQYLGENPSELLGIIINIVIYFSIAPLKNALVNVFNILPY